MDVLHLSLHADRVVDRAFGDVSMTQRPPAFVGRDDLETLMASPNAEDWVKISTMLLGPPPEGFKFQPKHKSNATFKRASRGTWIR